MRSFCMKKVQVKKVSWIPVRRDIFFSRVEGILSEFLLVPVLLCFITITAEYALLPDRDGTSLPGLSVYWLLRRFPPAVAAWWFQ